MKRTPPRTGAFIVFEGVEGSGKSTQAGRLVESLLAAGCDVVLTHEPGGTALGSGVRKLLLESGSRPTGVAELFLYLADRAQHVAEVVEPALERGSIVVSDRFSPSTIAYQGTGRSLGKNLVAEACSVAAGGLEPDLVILLDLAPDEGLRRIRYGSDRMEREPLEFHERVREAYLDQARRDPARFAVVDSSLSPDEVEKAISRTVRKRLGIPEPLPD